MAFLAQDLQKKRLINIDETWLGIPDYRRLHWRPYKTNYSLPVKKLQPRISMITAVDSNGNVYISLTQSNSN